MWVWDVCVLVVSYICLGWGVLAIVDRVVQCIWFSNEVICVEVSFPFSGKFTWQKTSLL